MQIRTQWIGYEGVDRDAAAEVTLDNFAFEQSAEILTVEPRLATLAELVRLAQPDSDLQERVRHLAGVLVGPDRQVTLCTPMSETSHRVGSALRGATTLRRYLDALASLAARDDAQQ